MGKAFADMADKLRKRRDRRVELTAQLTGLLEQLEQDPALSPTQLEHIEQMRQLLIQFPE
jgi:hypothetical protein